MDTKPTAPSLDVGHPLKGNLVFAVILGTGDANGLKDLIGNIAPTTSGITFTTGANGPRAVFGTSSYLNFGPSNAFLPTGDITVVIGWKSTASSNEDQAILQVNTGSTDRFALFGPWVDGNIYFDYGDIFAGGRVAGAYGTVGDDVLLASMATAVGGPKKIWKNGSSIASVAILAPGMTASSADFIIGAGGLFANGRAGELDFILIYDTSITDAGTVAGIFADPVEPFRPQIPVLSGSPTINTAASTLTVVWDQSVTDNAGTITLSGQRNTITVGAIQSGDGTATHVYPLSPTGKVFLQALEAGSITVTIPAAKVSGATEDNEVVTGQAVTNNSTQIYTPVGTHTYKVEADGLYSNTDTGTIGGRSGVGRGRHRGRRRGRWM